MAEQRKTGLYLKIDPSILNEFREKTKRNDENMRREVTKFIKKYNSEN